MASKRKLDADSELDQNIKKPNNQQSSDDHLLKFYWFDICEENNNNNNSSPNESLYLFGKIEIDENLFESACCIVKNISKCIYILPIEAATMKQIEDEMKSIFEKYSINDFNTEIVKKYYCFGSSHKTPCAKNEYLKVEYNLNNTAIKIQLERDLNRSQYFSKIHGMQQTYLERFLIDLKIKGPCWLNLKSSSENSNLHSSCKHEFEVDFKNVSILQLDSPPPLNTLTLNIKTMINSETNEHEIIFASGLVSKKCNLNESRTIKCNEAFYELDFCLIAKPANPKLFPSDFSEKKSIYNDQFKIQEFASERMLLSFLLNRFKIFDIDLLIGYDLYNFSLDKLLQRCINYKLLNWHELGRLKRKEFPVLSNDNNLNSNAIQKYFSGRLLCDVMLSAKELVIDCKSFTNLHDLASFVLFKDKESISPLYNNLLKRNFDEEYIENYLNSSSELIRYCANMMNDTNLIMRLCINLQCLPLAYKISCLVGNVISKTFNGSILERIDYLLLHAFNEKNYILPNKNQIKNNQAINSFTGGLVLDPKTGFYGKYVLLLDYNSLYPSIIQEYNICFSTVDRIDNELIDKDIEEFLKKYVKSPDLNIEPGVLTQVINKLVNKRRELKNRMNEPSIDENNRLQLDIEQKALKSIANSIYGCIGSDKSRFYCKSIATLIAKEGRNLLIQTKEFIEEKKNLEIIYGDTDSLMINTKSNQYQDAIQLGNELKNEINLLHNKISIEFEMVFKSLLLLCKKKYAGLKVCPVSLTENKIIKGIDVVRRDLCAISKQIGEQVIDEILSASETDKMTTNINKIFIEVAKKIENNEFDLKNFTISILLSKNPEDYKDPNSLSYVLVALRNNSTKNNKKYKAGCLVTYIICEDGTQNNEIKRAYLKSEISKDEDNLKIDKDFYKNSILKTVEQICEPLVPKIDSFNLAQILGLDLLGFKNCFGFNYKCSKCGIEQSWRSALSIIEQQKNSCSNDTCDLKPSNDIENIKNLIVSQLKVYFERFYNKNDDYTHAQFVNQIKFFKYIFDLNEFKRHNKEYTESLDEDSSNVLNEIKEIVDRILKSDGFQSILQTFTNLPLDTESDIIVNIISYCKKINSLGNDYLQIKALDIEKNIKVISAWNITNLGPFFNFTDWNEITDLTRIDGKYLEITVKKSKSKNYISILSINDILN